MINLIENSIKNITKTYQQNELAFLAMQGKIELQLRDKMAWYIEQKNANYGYVRREYNPYGRKKCDIAILDQNYNPKCLIEFKAHSLARYEKEFLDACKKDISKMKGISQKLQKFPQKFYIFFQTEHTGNNIVDNEQGKNGMITYYKNIPIGVEKAKKYKSVQKFIYNQWDNDYSQFGTINKTEIDAGESYGIGVKIHVMFLEIDENSPGYLSL